jgi:hypothetical protein
MKYRIIETRWGVYVQKLVKKRCGFLWRKEKEVWEYWMTHPISGDSFVSRFLSVEDAKREIKGEVAKDKKFINGAIVHRVD